MKATARTILTHSLLVAFALASTAALAACAGGSGAAQETAATAAGSAGTASGSADASASTGTAAHPGAAGESASPGAGGAAAGGATLADVPEVARALACPAPGSAAPQVALRPGGQGIPAGFRPVAVVQCLPGGAFVSLHGEGAHVRKEAAITGLAPLVAALREPSTAPADTSCPVAPALPGLALIGRNGVVIYPRIPITACGAPIPAVTASLAALHWIMLATTRVPQGVLRVPQGGTRPLSVQPQRALSPPIVGRPGSGLSVAG